MTATQAAVLVKRVLGAYPTQRQRMSEDDVMAMTVSYMAGLIDLEYDIACVAVDRANKTSEFMPTIARIRSEVGEISIGGRRSGAEAWGDVLRAVRRYGYTNTPRFGDSLVAEAVSAVGWDAICNANVTDASTRSKFADAYNSLVARARKETQVAVGGGRVREAASLPPANDPDQYERAALTEPEHIGKNITQLLIGKVGK